MNESSKKISKSPKKTAPISFVYHTCKITIRVYPCTSKSPNKNKTEPVQSKFLQIPQFSAYDQLNSSPKHGKKKRVLTSN